MHQVQKKQNILLSASGVHLFDGKLRFDRNERSPLQRATRLSPEYVHCPIAAPAVAANVPPAPTNGTDQSSPPVECVPHALKNGTVTAPSGVSAPPALSSSSVGAYSGVCLPSTATNNAVPSSASFSVPTSSNGTVSRPHGMCMPPAPPAPTNGAEDCSLGVTCAQTKSTVGSSPGLSVAATVAKSTVGSSPGLSVPGTVHSGNVTHVESSSGLVAVDGLALPDMTVFEDEKLMEGFDDTPYQDFFPRFLSVDESTDASRLNGESIVG